MPPSNRVDLTVRECNRCYTKQQKPYTKLRVQAQAPYQRYVLAFRWDEHLDWPEGTVVQVSVEEVHWSGPDYLNIVRIHDVELPEGGESFLPAVTKPLVVVAGECLEAFAAEYQGLLPCMAELARAVRDSGYPLDPRLSSLLDQPPKPSPSAIDEDAPFAEPQQPDPFLVDDDDPFADDPAGTTYLGDA